MSARFTTGPWVRKGAATIKSVSGALVSYISRPRAGIGRAEWEANVRLMTAAPELFDAGSALAGAAAAVHPTAPSVTSIEALHRAIEQWNRAALAASDAT